MKTLLVVRHAKSSWAMPSLDDFDRPLNDRGKRDAPEMAQRIRRRKILPDLLVSSPAKRAWETMNYFAKEFAVPKQNILAIDALYHAPVSVFYQTIRSLDSITDRSVDCVAIFSHNPGITMFVNDLGLARLDNMPTCGVFSLQAETKIWSGFETAQKSFLFVDFPKLHQ